MCIFFIFIQFYCETLLSFFVSFFVVLVVGFLFPSLVFVVVLVLFVFVAVLFLVVFVVLVLFPVFPVFVVFVVLVVLIVFSFGFSSGFLWIVQTSVI